MSRIPFSETKDYKTNIALNYAWNWIVENVKSPDWRDDCLQEARIGVWQFLNRCPDAHQNQINAAAAGKARKALRNAPHIKPPSNLRDKGGGIEVWCLGLSTGGTAPGADVVLEQRERTEKLDNALMALDSRKRKALLLLADGKTPHQIARELQTPLEKTEKIIASAQDEMKAALR